MGSLLSGRWWNHQKARTVEECVVLDLGELARQGAFVPGSCGYVRWHQGRTEVASVSFRMLPGQAGLALSLRWPFGAKDATEIVETIRLETLPLHFGGVRWWGRCPLIVDGRPCNRRIEKLHLPPGATYFGCRLCHNL